MPVLRALVALLLVGCGSGAAATAIGDAGAPADAAVEPTPDGAPGGPDAAPVHAEVRLPGKTAVKALAAGDGTLVLLETLQTQLIVTIPARELVALDSRLESTRRFPSIDGWTLIDAAAHPSGDVSAVYLRVDYADPAPLHIQLSRWRPDGSRVDTEVAQVPLSDPSDLSARLVASYDRARLVAAGEEVYLAARWAGNAVFAYRFRFGAAGFEAEWATRVEPETSLLVLGIIGGGFDNFHQGDNKMFVYLDVNAAGNAYVAVPSAEGLLDHHDAAFGEQLLAGADPEHFDFGTAVLTKLDAGGRRVYARLLGTPGRGKSLLGMRASGDSLLLVGRVKIAAEPGGWDAWILSARAADGAVNLERAVNVTQGDMFWDAVAVPGAGIVAVGATGYAQNPSGLSVSDERDALAVVLDVQGRVVERLALPRGTGGRGDEAMSVRPGPGGRLVVAGMLDGPGTHAEVSSDGFVDVVGR